MIELYSLTSRGERLAHSYNSPSDSPAWGVIHFLKKRGIATKEQIYANVNGATASTLASLKIKRIIQGGREVSV